MANFMGPESGKGLGGGGGGGGGERFRGPGLNLEKRVWSHPSANFLSMHDPPPPPPPLPFTTNYSGPALARDKAGT